MLSTYGRGEDDDDRGEGHNGIPPCEKGSHDIPSLMDSALSEDDVAARDDHCRQPTKLSIETEKPPSPTDVSNFESAVVAEESTKILKQSPFLGSDVAGVGEISGTEPLSNFGKSDSVSTIALRNRREHIYDGGTSSMSISTTRRCLIEENQCIVRLKARLRQIEKKVLDARLCS